MKNSNDTIGNRTRDLSACSAVPQPTAPPRAPSLYVVVPYKMFSYQICSEHVFECSEASLFCVQRRRRHS
jgi:hypothetical protein